MQLPRRTEIEAHEEVGHGEVTDEELGHVDPAPAEGEDEHHAAVTEEGQEEDDPDAAAEGPPVEQVVAGEERTWDGNNKY